MSKLQSELLESEVLYPEAWPERKTDYSRVDEAEYALLSAAHKQKSLGAKDRIQTALGELKDLLYLSAVLADDDVSAKQRCETTLQVVLASVLLGLVLYRYCSIEADTGGA